MIAAITGELVWIREGVYLCYDYPTYHQPVECYENNHPCTGVYVSRHESKYGVHILINIQNIGYRYINERDLISL